MARIKISELPRISSRDELTSDDLILLNDGSTTKTIPANILSNKVGTGFSNTGAFAGKPLSNQYVWEAGAGIEYTQEDVDNGTWKVFSLDEDVHLAVDNPYWSDPAPSGQTGIGLFQGANLPIGFDTMVDYSSSFNDIYPTVNDFSISPTSAGSIASFNYFSGSVGRIDLSDSLPGDQLRVRFAFNIIPQVSNTTIEPALWYSNRNADNKETFSFPLTNAPIFFGTATPGNIILNRAEISAWITSTEDVNALALPAIKSNNPVTIQPLDMLITILR